MTRKQALSFLKQQANRMPWKQIASGIGEKESVVYSWVRRGSVPKWQVKAVEDYARKMETLDAGRQG